MSAPSLRRSLDRSKLCGTNLNAQLASRTSEAEHPIHEGCPGPAPQLSPPSVPPTRPIPGDHVMLAQQSKGGGELLEIELPIAIGQKDVVHPGSIEPRTDGGPVSTVSRVHDDLELGNALPKRFQDPRRVIRAAIVHDDDLELGGEPAPDLGGLHDHASDIAFLVETRNHHRKTHRAEPNSRTTPLQWRK